MAWTDQCKIAFKATADHQIFQQKGKKNITKVLRKISKESGIPFNTLKRWYYDKEEDKLNRIRNGTVPELVDKADECEVSPILPTERPMCTRCKNNPVEIVSSTKRPLPESSKYYGLCNQCRKRAKIINDAIKLANEENNGNWITCPHCEESFLIPKGD